MNVGSFSFGSPVSASDVNKPIFEIKATEDNTNISTPMLSGSGKKVVSFGSMALNASPKISGGGLLIISAQGDQKVLSLDHQKGEMNLRHCPK